MKSVYHLSKDLLDQVNDQIKQRNNLYRKYQDELSSRRASYLLGELNRLKQIKSVLQDHIKYYKKYEKL